MNGKIFIISAPCGAGKSSLVSVVHKGLRCDFSIEPVITYTTRKPRGQEQEGLEYYFLDIHEFKRRIQKNFFLEWSDAHTAYYGSPQSLVEERQKGRSFLLIVDRVGAQKIIAQVPDVVLIWIEVPSLMILKERLLKRSTESDEQIERRLKQSKIEIELEQQKPLYHYKVMNDNFENAAAKLTAIIRANLKRD